MMEYDSGVLQSTECQGGPSIPMDLDADQSLNGEASCIGPVASSKHNILMDVDVPYSDHYQTWLSNKTSEVETNLNNRLNESQPLDIYQDWISKDDRAFDRFSQWIFNELHSSEFKNKLPPVLDAGVVEGNDSCLMSIDADSCLDQSYVPAATQSGYQSIGWTKYGPKAGSH